MNRIHATVSLALLVAAVGCVSAAEEPENDTTSSIVGGATDTGHLSVAVIQWDVNSGGKKTGSSICSGTLIAPTVILTAAHCVSPANAGETYTNYVAYFGTTPGTAKAEEIYKGASIAAHPKYSSKVLGSYDVGVVKLDRAVTGVPLVPVAKSLPSLVGRSVTHVGWGTSISNSATDKQGSGTKRTVTLPVTEMLTQKILTGNGKSGICNGDSGGPALLAAGGGEIVVGIHSYIDNNTTCLGNGFSFRPDTAADFIAQYAPNALKDLAADPAAPKPPPGGGAAPPPAAPPPAPKTGADLCCVNGACYVCPDKAALDRCVGIDLNACFAACKGDAACFGQCGQKAGAAKHDPSLCKAQ